MRLSIQSSCVAAAQKTRQLVGARVRKESAACSKGKPDVKCAQRSGTALATADGATHTSFRRRNDRKSITQPWRAERLHCTSARQRTAYRVHHVALKFTIWCTRDELTTIACSTIVYLIFRMPEQGVEHTDAFTQTRYKTRTQRRIHTHTHTHTHQHIYSHLHALTQALPLRKGHSHE